MHAAVRRNALTRAFTLIELLTVIAIIAVLAGLLFPVFATARGKAREITCVSNLRQIGLSIKMYAQDYDELFPWAVDPTDKYTPEIWAGFPDFQKLIPDMPFLHQTLQTYIKSQELFRCPADVGYEIDDFNGAKPRSPHEAKPTAYIAYGTSYVYRTEIAFLHAGENSFRDPTNLNVLFDSAGHWHNGLIINLGDLQSPDLRYNVLHGDGHTKKLTRRQLDAEWRLPVN